MPVSLAKVPLSIINSKLFASEGIAILLPLLIVSFEIAILDVPGGTLYVCPGGIVYSSMLYDICARQTFVSRRADSKNIIFFIVVPVSG
jgi:hypothetical protein